MQHQFSRWMDGLEPRTLLSASWSGVTPGLLVVEGTPGNDLLSIRVKGTQLRVILNGVMQKFSAASANLIEISTGEGNDIVDWSGISINAYINAGLGNDSVVAGLGNDSLTGAGGKDTLRGGAGNDRINGANSPDILYGDDGSDVIYGGFGDDYAEGGVGVDWLFGEDGADRLLGGLNNDRIYGGAGADRLWGLEHNDLLNGDGGNDRLFGGAGNDQLYGGPGVDGIYGEIGNDGIFARDGKADALDGGDGLDTAQVDTTELQVLTVETIDAPLTVPPPVEPPPVDPPPINTKHPVALSFNDEALWDANFNTSVAEAKKLGVTAIRLWMAISSWNERPHAWDTVTKQQIVSTWNATSNEQRAVVSPFVLKRAFELKRQGFTILLTVDHSNGDVPQSADQVRSLFNHLMTQTETPTSTQKFKDVIDYWEIGNEVDIPESWKPIGVNKTAGLKSYVDQLLLPAADALKPQGEPVVSSSVRFNPDDLKIILEQVKTRGRLSDIAYAGFHAYGSYDANNRTNYDLPAYTEKAVAIAKSYGKTMIATEWNVTGFSRSGTQNMQWAKAVDQVYRKYILPNYEIAFYYTLVNNEAGRGTGGTTSRPAGALKHNFAGTISSSSTIEQLIAYYESPLVRADPFYSTLDGWK